MMNLYCTHSHKNEKGVTICCPCNNSQFKLFEANQTLIVCQDCPHSVLDHSKSLPNICRSESCKY